MIRTITRFLLSRLSTGEATNLLIARVGALPTHRILTTDEAGRLLVRGRPLSVEERFKLKEQAEAIRESGAWKLLRENILYEAVSKGIHEALTTEQLHFSKAAIWHSQQFDQLLNTLAGPGNLPLSEDL